MQLVFVNVRGEKSKVAFAVGETIMRTAIENGVEGIVAECGGALACATCHIYIDTQWASRLAAPSEAEEELLDCVSERRPESRLSCQIALDPSLDGLIVNIPESQF